MKDNKQSWLSKLMKYAGRYKVLTIIGCLLSAISSAISVAPYLCVYFVVKNIFNTWPQFSESSTLTRYGWIAVAFAASSIIIYFIGLLCTHTAAFRISKNMKKAAVEHIVDLPMGYFSRQTSGRLRKIIDDNTAMTETFLAHQMPDMVGAMVLPVVIFILLFTFDWRLGILCLLPMIIGSLFQMPMFSGNNAGFMKTYMDALENMNGQAVEFIRGMPVIKVFQQTVYSFKSFHQSIMKYKEFASNYSKSSQLPMVGFTVATNGAIFLLVPAAIIILKGATSPTDFLLDFVFYALLSPVCASMMTRVLYVAEGSMQAKEAVDRIETIKNEPCLQEPVSPQRPDNASVEFSDVSFTYAGATSPAVDHVSFLIRPGETIALVGASGGGKTTVASLVPRFFDVNTGSVKIGGIDVRNIKTDDLMQNIAFVFQDTHLFKASIEENIRIAKPSATEDEIMAALHAAQCDDIIQKLPQGIHTVIGEKGIYLSGGEQQRLSLARAILKDAPIVILDEATAFADSENEAAIQKAFEKLMSNKTVLMIAHRLSTIKNADEILVMQDGKICERGIHRELISQNGIYTKMWNDYQTSIAWRIRKEAQA